MDRKLQRPYVVIHTHTTIDGNTRHIEEAASLLYQEIALHPRKHRLGIQGYLNGKNTTEERLTLHRQPSLNENAPEVPPGDYIVYPDAPMYYLSMDARGELAFESNVCTYGGISAHIVEVLTEQASNAYKDFLRRKKISYIIAGEKEIDLELMLDKFYNLLNIKRMMVGGGGTLNWTFVQQRLVDEISIILAPIANGEPATQRIFTAKAPFSIVQPTTFKLKSVEHLKYDTLWLRYTVLPATDRSSIYSKEAPPPIPYY